MLRKASQHGIESFKITITTSEISLNEKKKNVILSDILGGIRCDEYSQGIPCNKVSASFHFGVPIFLLSSIRNVKLLLKSESSKNVDGTTRLIPGI